MQEQTLIPHLFRTEFTKITAVLCKIFGIEYMQVAEDIASETFLAALETWSYKGLPENPVAWLYVVAKNKANNFIKRNNLYNTKVIQELKRSGTENENETDYIEIDLSESNILDSQLQMLFAICNPVISPEAQIGLALRILCGFGIEEIATAFLSNKEAIGKRLYRAKEKLREQNIAIIFPGDTEIDSRLYNVLTTLYLLFNEGYYSESNDDVLREDLCQEAMRLVWLLLENEKTNTPVAHAVFALMCFHSSRFAARKNEAGELVLYKDQDESLWDKSLIEKGCWHMHLASKGNKLTRYHLEAGIAYWHTIKDDSREKWENILQLYNRLLQLEYLPIAALNRTYVLSKANSKEAAIIEAEKLQLTNNHFYFILLGELYTGINDDKAKTSLEKALILAKTQSDKATIKKKLEDLQKLQ